MKLKITNIFNITIINLKLIQSIIYFMLFSVIQTDYRSNFNLIFKHLCSQNQQYKLSSEQNFSKSKKNIKSLSKTTYFMFKQGPTSKKLFQLIVQILIKLLRFFFFVTKKLCYFILNIIRLNDIILFFLKQIVEIFLQTINLIA